MKPDIDLSHSPLPIRRAIVDMPPFHPPSVSLDLDDPGGALQMNLNEPAAPCGEAVRLALLAALDRVGRYPDPRCRGVIAMLAGHLGVAPERITVGNGSDEMINLVATAFLEPGVNAVIPVPAFPRYQATAQIAGASVHAVAVRADGVPDVEALLAAVDVHTRVLWCATPNNPTGGWLDDAAVDRLVSGTPPHVVLAIDEAYFEFGREAGAPAILSRLAGRSGPWVVLRTLSKAYGLAGLRVGYAVASSSEMAEAFNRIRTVFSVNVLAQAAAVAALGDQASMVAIVRDCILERERLRSGLAARGFRCLPSAANFLAVETRMPAAEAVARLRAGGVLVTPIGGPRFPHFLRVTVGARADNDRFLAAIGSLA